MKLRPVLLVLVLLSGFYYVTTHGASKGHAIPWMQTPGGADFTHQAVFTGAKGTFDLQ